MREKPHIEGEGALPGFEGGVEWFAEAAGPHFGGLFFRHRVSRFLDQWCEDVTFRWLRCFRKAHVKADGTGFRANVFSQELDEATEVIGSH
jgi:hypothetical protein